MARLNVLMYCLSSMSGGAVAYLRNLAPLLAQRFTQSDAGHRLKFLAHEEQAPLLEGVEDARICWVRGARPRGYRRVWWEQRELAALLHQEQADIVFNPYQIGIHIPDLRQVMMVQNMEPFLFQKYRYSPDTWLRNHFLRRYSIRSLRRADRVIAISGFVRNHLIRAIGIRAESIRMIYHGRPAFGVHNDPSKDRDLLRQIGVENDYVLTCGSLLPYRRCEDVIAAFNQCAPALHAGTQLVIAGSGTDRRYAETIRQAIAHSPVHERIHALGQVPWETMAALYRHCSICVIATEIEACPNIAIEAMSAGCMIVSADRSPLPEIFQDCSLEYRARDIGHLTQQMRRAVEDETLRREMRAKALKRTEDFSWENCAEKTYAALTEWP